MSSNGSYIVTENDGYVLDEEIDEKKYVWTVYCKPRDDRVYTYEEAIDLAGSGWYNKGLLIAMIIAYIAMSVDMFGFSVIVTGCSCDFQLDLHEQSILLAVPFIGPVMMAFFWGYFSDTKGRKKCLYVSMWGSCFASFVSTFSPNWIILGIFKFISCSFCSCAQSVTFVLLGESVTEKNRGPYLLLLTSLSLTSFSLYYVLGYIILNMDFEYNLGIIHFTPWRLLTLLLSLPLGLAAIILDLYYESPKFLLNMNQNDHAVWVLKNIFRRNGGEIRKYPVRRVVLNEEGNEGVNSNLPLWESLKKQTVPLFKNPLLIRTMQLMYLVTCVYSCTNTVLMWFPTLANTFFDGVHESSDDEDDEALCKMITYTFQNNSTLSIVDDEKCISTLEYQTMLVIIAQGILFPILNIIVSKFAARKKTVLLIILVLSFTSAMVSLNVSNYLASFILFIGTLMSKLCIGILYSFFVYIFPTTYRGMASCLGAMVSRLGALVAINLFGFYFMDYCDNTFYIWAAVMFSTLLVALYLPPDTPIEEEEDIE